ncbi:MAG: hypothetical protein ACKN9U_09180 [Pirellulaceae bacterium]
MRPELPDSVVVQVWPASGDSAFHPSDLELAKSWIPSSRVFLRTAFDGKYYHLSYGDQSLRMAPSLVTKVPMEDLQVGDRVEVLSLLLERDPVLAEIIEKRWDQEKQQIVYEIIHRQIPVERPYSRTELRLLTPRHPALTSHETIRREIPPDEVFG